MNSHYQTLILGGGLSGLTVAHKLLLHKPNHSFLVLEKQGRTGGVIKSHHDQGFITELGPHGFLDNSKESRDILVETGLDKECVKAELLEFVRYVYLHGKLNLIPQTPQKIFMAPLISWPQKLRVIGDLFKPYLEGEPSVAKWVKHRFGPALLPYLDAVYTGTYAGDFDRLTIDSVMPGVRALEKEHGSVIRGLVARMRDKKKKEGKKSKLTMPAMTSFPGGMERLVEKLSEKLTGCKNLQLNCDIKSVRRGEKGWAVTTSTGTYSAASIVFALPINVTLRLLLPFAKGLPLQQVPQTWINTVVFGFTNDVEIPPGFGYLIPEQEKRFTLGTLFSSNMFPGRAPEGHIVFETLVGGRRHPERLELDDKSLTQKTFEDVREILNISKDPVYTTVLRSDGAIPQLERNYPQLLLWKEQFLLNNQDAHICGFGWGGIGLNDMMKHATQVAEQLVSDTRTLGGKKEVKGIYF